MNSKDRLTAKIIIQETLDAVDQSEVELQMNNEEERNKSKQSLRIGLTFIGVVLLIGIIVIIFFI